MSTGTEVTAPSRELPLARLERCPLCAGGPLQHYHTRPSLFMKDRTISYDRCLGCGIVFRNPRPQDNARLEAYQNKTPSAEMLETGWDDRTGRHFGFVIERMRRLGIAGPGLPVLDFGCGAGAFLAAARDHGLLAEGLEVCRALAKAAASRSGRPVIDSPLGHPTWNGRRYGAVFTSMVFEHLTDPAGTLAALRRMVEPGGLVVIEVPNLRDLREVLRRGSTLDDAHLFYFDRKSLKDLFDRAGVDLLRVEEGVRLHRYVSLAGRPIPFAISSVLERLTRVAGINTSLTAYGRVRRGDGPAGAGAARAARPDADPPPTSDQG